MLCTTPGCSPGFFFHVNEHLSVSSEQQANSKAAFLHYTWKFIFPALLPWTRFAHLNSTFLQTHTFSGATISIVMTEGRILSSCKGETPEWQQCLVWESAAHVPTVLVLPSASTPSEPWAVPTLLCPVHVEPPSPALCAVSLCQGPSEPTGHAGLAQGQTGLAQWQTGLAHSDKQGWHSDKHICAGQGTPGTICQEMAREHSPGCHRHRETRRVQSAHKGQPLRPAGNLTS